MENWVNNNGIETLNTYDAVTFTGLSRGTVTNNQVYDWSGGVNSHRYSLSIWTVPLMVSVARTPS
jgi:hypothetical protein